jgi:hypothetical protein
MILSLLAFKVSGIGVLPILLVIVSAIFLWGMLVYNSLKNRKSNTDAYLQNVGKLAFQRVQLLTQLGQLLKTDFLTDAEGYNETRLQTETQRIDETIASLLQQNNPEVQSLQTRLSQNAAQLVQSQRKFRAARKNYNELCEQMPYRLIASTFAFKPLAA